jgi:hypothetical protein
MSNRIELSRGAVLVQGEQALRQLQACVHAGIERRHRNGLSDGDLRPLATAFSRAAMAARGHECAYVVVPEKEWNHQNVRLYDTAEVAAMVQLSQRHTRRLAAQNQRGRRFGNIWVLTDADVLALKQIVEGKAKDAC